MKFWLFCIFFSSAALFGADFRLKDRLEKAAVGDYAVTEANKMITVLSIRSITPASVILEEISAPIQNLKNRPDSWSEWVKAKAPGHTSWSMVEIDLQSGEILECFSFSRSAWLQLSQKESIIGTLIHLPMKKTPEGNRRKIGPPPYGRRSRLQKSVEPFSSF